jgi:hypothetical protein
MYFNKKSCASYKGGTYDLSRCTVSILSKYSFVMFIQFYLSLVRVILERKKFGEQQKTLFKIKESLLRKMMMK